MKYKVKPCFKETIVCFSNCPKKEFGEFSDETNRIRFSTVSPRAKRTTAIEKGAQCPVKFLSELKPLSICEEQSHLSAISDAKHAENKKAKINKDKSNSSCDGDSIIKYIN